MVAATLQVRGDLVGRYGLSVFRLQDGQQKWKTQLKQGPPVSHSDPAQIGSLWRWRTVPDLDGDGERDLITAHLEISKRTKEEETLFVHAMSGANGKLLWWWREKLVARTLQLEPLALWQQGADGHPLLIVPTQMNSGLARSVPLHSYVLQLSRGELAHILTDVSDPQCIDLDGDSLPECVYTYRQEQYQPTTTGFAEPQPRSRVVDQQAQLRVLRGQPAEVWRRLGAWRAIQDSDGDGLEDVARVTVRYGSDFATESRVAAASGRTGEQLWPGRGQRAVRPIRTSRHAIPRRIENLLLALPLPAGDLDSDGLPDLVVRDDSDEIRGKLSAQLQALSGRTGQPLWSTAEISGPRNLFYDRNNSRRPMLILPTGPDSPPEFAYLRLFNAFSGFSDRSGPHRWQAVVMSPTEYTVRLIDLGSFPNNLPGNMDIDKLPTVALDLGGARPDLVSVVLSDHTDAVFSFALQVKEVSSGKQRWRHPLKLKYKGTVYTPWPTPTAGDLDGDGQPEVVCFDEDRIVALQGDNGQPLWTHALPAQMYQLLKHSLPPLVLADLEGKGRRAVCYSTHHASGEIVAVQARGQELARRGQLGGWTPNAYLLHFQAHDLEGDGRDQLVLSSGQGLRVLHGPRLELGWFWPTKREDAAPDWILAEVRPGRPATVVVQAESRREIVGLDGKTGVVLWRGRFPKDSQAEPLFSEVENEGPRVIASRLNGDTICTVSVPGPVPDLVSPLPPGSYDPRRVRLLPWYDWFPGQSAILVFSVFPLLGVAVYLVPWWLFRRWRQHRVWAASYPLLAWVAFVALGISLIPSYELFLPVGTPWYATVQIILFMGLSGLLLWLPLLSLAHWSWHRRWLRIGLLFGFWGLVTFAVAAFWLYYDQPRRDPDDVYSWERSWTVLLAGYFLLCVALFLGSVLIWISSTITRWMRRRK